MKNLPLTFVVALLTTSSAHAAGIACRAERDLFCDLKGCASDAGDGFYVTVSYDPAANGGDLCTFTYCRDFTLLRLPGSSTKPEDGLLGATRSSASGSMEEQQNTPALDYLLWIAPDHTRFVLFGQGDNLASGWAGACRPR